MPELSLADLVAASLADTESETTRVSDICLAAYMFAPVTSVTANESLADLEDAAILAMLSVVDSISDIDFGKVRTVALLSVVDSISDIDLLANSCLAGLADTATESNVEREIVATFATESVMERISEGDLVNVIEPMTASEIETPMESETDREKAAERLIVSMMAAESETDRLRTATRLTVSKIVLESDRERKNARAVEEDSDTPTDSDSALLYLTVRAIASVTVRD